jgi:hypothetical protein
MYGRQQTPMLTGKRDKVLVEYYKTSKNELSLGK